MQSSPTAASDYTQAMGRLLVLYTQIDQFIMESCAERITNAPCQRAKLGLAKQVGDESRHVQIQKDWMTQFDIDPSPVIEQTSIQRIHAHFRELNWIDFLTDLYLVVEALGSHAVEQIVPLADPGTQESLRVPLEDELDHVAFGIAELRAALSALDGPECEAIVQRIPIRIAYLSNLFVGLDIPVQRWFENVGADYRHVCTMLEQRKDELLREVAA